MNAKCGNGITAPTCFSRFQADVRAVEMEPANLFVKTQTGSRSKNQDNLIERCNPMNPGPFSAQNRGIGCTVKVTKVLPLVVDSINTQHAPIRILTVKKANSRFDFCPPAWRQINILVREYQQVINRRASQDIVIRGGGA